jgi:copper transport protein
VKPAPRRRNLRLAFIGLLLGLTAVGATAAPASAHASLVSVDPPDGARLDQSPPAVTLTFSEHVSADLGGVRVLDATGAQVQDGAARVDGAQVVVDLKDDLPAGTYVVSYRVISADGHPVRGGSVFGVGAGDVDAGALARVNDRGEDRPWEIVGGIGRALAYAGVLLAAGGALFLTIAHPGGDSRTTVERALLIRRVRWAALVGALASLVALPVQAALGTGQGPGSLFDSGVLAEVVADGVGLGMVLAVAGLALLALWLTQSRAITVASALVAAGSFAATGHTRVGDTAVIATVADIAHLEAAAVWGGGLMLLAWTLRSRREAAIGADVGAAAIVPAGRATVTESARGPATAVLDVPPLDAIEPMATAGIVKRFSDLATVSILVVGAAGLVMGWSEVRALKALTSTGYGLTLLAKVAVVVAIAAMGAYNHFRLVPALAQGKARAGLARLRQTLRFEVIGLVAVLALTSVLVVTTPAKSTTQGGVVEEIVSLGDVGSVQLVVAPAKAGFNQIHIYTYDPSDRPTDIAENFTLQLSLPDADLGPIDREVTRAGPAHFQLNGDDLAVAGTWEITIRARIDQFTEATGTAKVRIA